MARMPSKRDPFSYRTDPAVPSFADDRPIIIFDGHCALCVGWIRFVMQRDHAKRFRFLSAQSALGRALYAHYGLDTDRLETNILLCEGRAWFKLEGSIRIASSLGFPWSLAATLRLIPTRGQTALYDLIANSRFVLFGRKDVCHRPAPTDADRFLA
ncbi:thiol-disulfide oxidoreductase [Methylobacterium sp. Leaf106]|nr:thiol-disulfide oxidoreductase [Methylobacterium sp. Leaf106]